ncbi:hypothetical protein EGR_06307 [Echinococcus granulosus]|uniref:PARP-type domain-containing protein n=1 Tax=Echinococcus granulosus TaxID=6210 RepID=W6UBW9_ECHGR|nr:hypothetical protein EGR_06307 [Echinococcus granulosus]EUB58883.1 hypothetical protein EGR_06307 [Echinococcus granulosus]
MYLWKTGSTEVNAALGQYSGDSSIFGAIRNTRLRGAEPASASSLDVELCAVLYLFMARMDSDRKYRAKRAKGSRPSHSFCKSTITMNSLRVEAHGQPRVLSGQMNIRYDCSCFVKGLKMFQQVMQLEGQSRIQEMKRNEGVVKCKMQLTFGTHSSLVKGGEGESILEVIFQSIFGGSFP